MEKAAHFDCIFAPVATKEKLTRRASGRMLTKRTADLDGKFLRRGPVIRMAPACAGLAFIVVGLNGYGM
jgi:hypothetical protein